MVWIILLLLLFSLITYLLFAPLSIEINTERNYYCIRYHWLGGVFIENEKEQWSAFVKILFWRRRLEQGRRPEETIPAAKEKRPETKEKKSRPLPWKKIAGLIRSFRVQQCELIIDTGDMQLNGWLYPLFYWSGRLSGKNIRISFTGETKILLIIKNNLARMVRAWIRS